MPDHRSFLDSLVAEDIGDARRDEPLSGHSTLRIGGPADLFVEPHRAEQISRVLARTAESGVPVVFIGDGSNLLFDDAGVRGIVVRIGRSLSRVAIQDTRVEAEAGVWVPDLARRVGKASLTGLEHAVGIPGTLGGLIVMNGGSRRESVGQVVRRVWVLDRAGALRALSAQQCAFAYRASALMNAGSVVVKAELACAGGDVRDIHAEMLDILRSRRHKFPLKQANCGSVFVSSPEMYHAHGAPGKVIEDAGLKGTRIGDALVSPRHANFIVNAGRARSEDVLGLIRHVRSTVHERTRIWMACEVQHVSAAGSIRPAHEAL
jgi:UDP-N-acetylmuramate dehydrogenase